MLLVGVFHFAQLHAHYTAHDMIDRGDNAGVAAEVFVHMNDFSRAASAFFQEYLGCGEAKAVYRLLHVPDHEGV